MNKIRNISTFIFGISLVCTGILQLLDSLYGSGILMILSGIIILLMRKELNDLYSGVIQKKKVK